MTRRLLPFASLLVLGMSACGGGGSADSAAPGRLNLNAVWRRLNETVFQRQLPEEVQRVRVIFDSSALRCCVKVDPNAVRDSVAGDHLLVLTALPIGSATVTLAGFTGNIAPANGVTAQCATAPADVGQPCDAGATTPDFESDPVDVVVSAEGRNDTALIQVQPVSSITGTVVNCQNRNPISGATVQLVTPRSDSATTAADGRFVFTRVPLGDFEVRGSAPGFIASSQSGVFSTPPAIDVTLALCPEIATPTVTPTNSPTLPSTLTPTNTLAPMATATPTNTPVDSATATPSNTVTATPSNTVTATLTPTNSPVNSPTATSTNTVTATLTNTETATPTVTNTATATETPMPTQTATGTPTPTVTLTDSPTLSPTATPTSTPTPRTVAFVTSGDLDTVSVIDVASNTVIATTAVGAFPTGITASPDRHFVYVACRSADEIDILDAVSGGVVSVVGTGANSGPLAIVFSPNGSLAYVANASANTLAVIDTTTALSNPGTAVITQIDAGGNSAGLAITPDGRFLYLANRVAGAAPGNTVSVIDAQAVVSDPSHAIVSTITVGLGADFVAITGDGRFAYVTNRSEPNGSVSVIDTAKAISDPQNAVTTTVPVNQGPVGVALTPDDRFAFVASFDTNSVNVIDTSSNVAVSTVLVGTSPLVVAITPDGRFAYVTDLNSASVSVIDTLKAVTDPLNAVVNTIAVDAGPQGVTIAAVPAGPGAPLVRLGPEFQVNTYTTSFQSFPRVATDGAGNFVVVWESDGQDGSTTGVFAQRYDDTGAPRGTEFQINTYTTGSQDNPAVATDGAGDFVFVWDSHVPGNAFGDIFAQRYDSMGARRGSEFQVNTYTTRGQYHPAVATDGVGNFVIVWGSIGQDGSGYGIFAQRYDSAGASQGSEFQVNTYTTDFQANPAVAADGSGNFVVVWQSTGQDGSGYGVFAQRYDSTGTRRGSEFQVNTYTTGAQRFPVVATDGSGNFVIVWASYGQDGSGYGVFGQRYDSTGVPRGSEFQVNTYTTSPQIFPSVATDGAGNFVIVWDNFGQGISQRDVFAQRYDSTGARQGSEFQVNTYTTSDQAGPRVATDGAGNFVVVWQSTGQDGSAQGIFAQRFQVTSGAASAPTSTPARTSTPPRTPTPTETVVDTATPTATASHTPTASPTPSPTGPPSLPEQVGPEFTVNTHILDAQTHPAIATANGSFVVVWDSYGQDYSGYGVFGQRLSTDGSRIGSEFQINTYTTRNQSNPAVATDSIGNFIVVWQSELQDGSYSGIFGQRFASDGTPAGTEFQANSEALGAQRNAVIAGSANGFVVAWEGPGSGYYRRVFAQRFDTGGSPAGTEFAVNADTQSSQRSPAVAADADGDFVIAWSASLPSQSGNAILAARFMSDGTALAGPFQVNTDPINGRAVPSIGVDSSGDFVVAWQSNYGNIDSQRFASDGTPVGTEFQVNTYTTGSQDQAAVTVDPSGSFVIAWESPYPSGSGYGIFAQRFGSDGLPSGQEFQVNSQSTGNTYGYQNQYGPVLASDASGGFTVVWERADQYQTGYPGFQFARDIAGHHFNLVNSPGPTSTPTPTPTQPPFNSGTPEAEIADVGNSGAVVVFPYIVTDSGAGTDTTIELSNSSTLAPMTVHCFYENATAHCSNNPQLVCKSAADCSAGTCVPGFSVNDFVIHLTASQPLAWRASRGLASAPLSNELIPPVPEDPFVGALRCLTVDAGTPDIPSFQDALLGHATIERYTQLPTSSLDVARYAAFKFASTGAGDQDTQAFLRCPNTSILPQFFDGAADPVLPNTAITTTLVLVPCSVDYLALLELPTTIVYRAFNEFEQRFSTTAVLSGEQVRSLSDIAPFFNVAVAGTLTGQIRLVGEQGGVLAVGIESRRSQTGVETTTAVSAFTQGVRSLSDVIVLP